MSIATANPFNRRIVTDLQYIVSSSLQSTTPSLDFIQAVPYPTTTERVVLFVTPIVTNAAFSASTGFTSSVYLQHSDDNSTWANIPQKAAPFVTLLYVSGSSTVLSSSVITSFEPDGKRYVRGSASYSPNGGALTGLSSSVTLTVGF